MQIIGKFLLQDVDRWKILRILLLAGSAFKWGALIAGQEGRETGTKNKAVNLTELTL